jgi:hypothetical protein
LLSPILSIIIESEKKNKTIIFINIIDKNYDFERDEQDESKRAGIYAGAGTPRQPDRCRAGAVDYPANAERFPQSSGRKHGGSAVPKGWEKAGTNGCRARILGLCASNGTDEDGF